MPKKYTPKSSPQTNTMNEFEIEAFNLIRKEKNTWEEAEVFVIENVSFRTRNLVRQCRKNYWGVFDQPIDPTTGRKKIWQPVTEEMCNAVVGKIDLDTKDVGVRARTQNGIHSAPIARAIVHDYLRKINFGGLLDESELQLAIDGTMVWKTVNTPDGPQTRLVDLLNFYIDPAVNSIKEAPAVIERSIMTKAEFDSYDWDNKDKASFKKNVQRNDHARGGFTTEGGETDLIDVYERWGLAPEYLITGNKEDTKLVNCHIVASGLDSRGGGAIHLIEKFDGPKPYIEARYTKVAGRWYGRGVAERLIMLQLWVNTVVNIRINRSYVSQLGLFKIRKSANVTPDMLKRLPANGAIVVNDLNDIEQFVMQEASQASYTDEANITSIARRVTSAFEQVTGGGLPASTPATNAVIQDRNSQTAFSMVREEIGRFIENWATYHALPLILKTIKPKDIVRVIGNDERIEDYREHIVMKLVKQKVDEINASGKTLSTSQVISMVDSIRNKVEKTGELFIDNMKKLVADDFDIEIVATNEKLDVAVMIDKLNYALGVTPEEKDTILPIIFDLMGVDVPRQSRRTQQAVQQVAQNRGTQLQQPQPTQGRSPQQMTTNANVPFQV